MCIHTHTHILNHRVNWTEPLYTYIERDGSIYLPTHLLKDKVFVGNVNIWGMWVEDNWEFFVLLLNFSVNLKLSILKVLKINLEKKVKWSRRGSEWQGRGQGVDRRKRKTHKALGI